MPEVLTGRPDIVTDRLTSSPEMLIGTIDEPMADARVDRRRMVVRGWHAYGGQPALAVAVTVRRDRASTTVTVPVGSEDRPDVARAAGVPALAGAGWRAVLDLADADASITEADLGTGAEPSGGEVAARIEVAVWPSTASPPTLLAEIPVVLVPGSGAPESREPAPGTPVACIDRPVQQVVERAVAVVSGWALLGDQLPDTVEVTLNGDPVGRARLGLPRADLAAEWSTPVAPVCGFDVLLDFAALPAADHRAHVSVHAAHEPSGRAVVADRWFEVAPPPPADEPLPARSRRLRDEVVAAARPSRPSSGPMNLAVFTHNLDVGGAQLWLTELLERAGAGRNFSCTVIAPARGALAARLEDQGVVVHAAPAGPWRGHDAYEGRTTELAAFLAAGGYDAVLANTVVAMPGADAGLAAGCPVVWAVHESWPPAAFAAVHLPPDAEGWVTRRFAEVVGGVHAVVAPARTTAQLYEGAAAPGRTVVVPYGIALEGIERFRGTTSREEARTALGVPAGARLLLMLATTDPRKGQSIAVCAFADAAAGRPAARLACVGAVEGEYTAALSELVRRSGLDDRVRLVPVVADPSPWYRAADVLLLASHVEALPLTALEAMAFGVPVVAPAIFGLTELLTDGVDGWLYQPADRRALAGALRRVLEEPAERLAQVGEAGRARVQAGFGSSHCAEDLMVLLEGLRRDPSALPGAIFQQAGRDPSARLARPLP